jgi:hypothetical protein
MVLLHTLRPAGRSCVSNTEGEMDAVIAQPITSHMAAMPGGQTGWLSANLPMLKRNHELFNQSQSHVGGDSRVRQGRNTANLPQIFPSQPSKKGRPNFIVPSQISLPGREMEVINLCLPRLVPPFSTAPNPFPSSPSPGTIWNHVLSLVIALVSKQIDEALRRCRSFRP